MQVFFFDRVSRAALDLAKKCDESGGIVIFEPSMIGEPRLFSEAIKLSHVFKYSQDRISDVHEVRGSAEPLLEIETLGSAGLRYRRRGRAWKEVDAFSIRQTVDTSGAGDWCTAGILHALCQEGIQGLHRATDQETLSGVRLGQAMAAWTCQFEGARGGMYGVGWADWKKDVLEIIQNGSTVEQVTHHSARVCPEVLLDICRPASVNPVSHAGHVHSPVENQVCATLWPGGGVGKALPQRT